VSVTQVETGDLLTVEELADAADVSVRTVRFYATKGLLPPPRLRGRLGLYDASHVARLQLVRELQAKGFTLAAIEGYLDRLPPDATAEDVAVYRALLTPWVTDAPEDLTRPQLAAAAGRPVSDDDLDRLAATGMVEVLDDGRVRTRPADLELGLQLLDVPVPRAMFEESQALIDAATGQLAEDLGDLLRRHLLRPYLHGDVPADQIDALSDVIERLKPLTLQAVMTAMQRSVDRAIRDRVARA
jgi:DNA-binding transcriptional MerR regulator